MPILLGSTSNPAQDYFSNANYDDELAFEKYRPEIQLQFLIDDDTYNNVIRPGVKSLRYMESKNGSSPRFFFKTYAGGLLQSLAKAITGNKSANSVGAYLMKYDADLKDPELAKLYQKLGVKNAYLLNSNPELAQRVAMYRYAYLYNKHVRNNGVTLPLLLQTNYIWNHGPANINRKAFRVNALGLITDSNNYMDNSRAYLSKNNLQYKKLGGLLKRFNKGGAVTHSAYWNKLAGNNFALGFDPFSLDPNEVYNMPMVYYNSPHTKESYDGGNDNITSTHVGKSLF